MEGDLLEVIPNVLSNPEFQAAILLGLTCVGAWVILTWLIQVLFSILWPFFAVVILLTIMPQWRRSLAKNFLPRYTDMFRHFTQRMMSYNATDA